MTETPRPEKPSLEGSEKILASRDRQRRYRHRQRAGIVMAPVPLTYSEIHLLIEAGLLCSSEDEDRRKIGEAIAKLISAISKNGRDA